MNKVELHLLYMNPKVFLFDKQIPPTSPWRYHLYRGARGTGKTFASTSWLYEKVINGAREVAIVGPSYSDLVKEILPVFEAHFPPHLMPKFNSKDNIYKCYNGCIVKVYSSDTEIRGLNAEYGIAEEICKWCDCIPEKIQERFDLFDLGVRSRRAKPNPQIFIASTPKPFDFFFNFEDKFNNHDSDYSMVTAKTDENIYLPEAAKKAFHAKYDNTRLGRQELEGILDRENPGAYWNYKLLESCRQPLPSFATPPVQPPQNAILMGHAQPISAPDAIYPIRTVIGFDPSVSKGGDECGIVIASLYSNKLVYVLADYSDQYDPGEYTQLINQLYQDYCASCIVVENNNGGNTFEFALRSVNAHMNIIPRNVHEGKTTRAEHISALYSQGKVFHNQSTDLSGLETQMCRFNVNYSKSPDRVDALGLALTELFWPTAPSSLQSIRNLPRYR